jgi:hypothetical protein
MMQDWEKDKILADSIRDALETQEEQYSPGAWENFVNLRKRRRRIVYLKTGTGIAASLLGIWLVIQVLVPEAINNRIETRHITYEKSEQSKEWTENNTITNEDPSHRVHVAREGKTSLPTKSEQTGTELILEEIDVRTEEIPQADAVESIALLDGLPDKPSGGADFTDSLMIEDGQSNPEPEKFVRWIHDEMETARVPAEKLKSGPDRVRFGVHFSPGFNSTSSNSTFAFAGGISADFRLTRRLGLSTGIMAAQQNVVLQQQNNQFMGLGKETTASMLFLDVPLNLTWKFHSDKSTSYYVSGGISSLAYLDEDYRNKTTTQELVEVVREENGQESVEYAVVTRETVTSESVRSFQSFDLAGRLNLMVGLEQQLAPGLYFHVEPYLKIPLSGLGAQNLRFTTSGIRCKVSF